MRHLHRGVAHLARLLTEDRAQQALLRGQLGLTLGRDLADEDVTGGDLGADADDPALVEVGEHLLGDVGDVAGDLLRPELGVAGVDLVLLDVDRGEDVLLHQALAEDDRVLVVVALPRHERDEQVGAQRHLAVVGAGSVGDRRADLEAVALGDQRTLVDARALVGAAELVQLVGRVGAVVVHRLDQVGRDLLDDPGLLGGQHVAGVDRGAVLDAGADEGRVALDERHGLALHVGAHERTVGVVVLEERDQRGGDRDHLARRDVHVVDLAGQQLGDLTVALADQDALVDEGVVVVEQGIGLRDDVAVLVVSRQVVDLVGDGAVLDLAVGRLDEPERVDPAVGGQRADQADVRALRGLDRAHPAVVRRVDVTDLHAGTVTGQTTGAECRETTLVRQPGDRVGLVHELAQLGGAEELLQRRDDGADVDQRLRRDRLDVLGRHPLAHHALHPGQTGAELVLDELADRTHPAVAEVVDVVGAHVDDALGRLDLLAAVVQDHDVADRGDDVGDRQRLLVEGLDQTELLVDLVATDLGEVVALGVEVVVLQQRQRGLTRGRLARAQLAVDVEQRVVGTLGVVLLLGELDRLELPQLLHDGLVVVLLADVLGDGLQGLEQDGDVLLALAVEADADQVALVDLELEPGAARGDHPRGVDVLVGRLVGVALEVDARAADQLGDHDALGAVDHEGALGRHEREVAHEDRLALDLTGVVVGELRGDVERSGVGEVLLLALVDGVLRVVEDRVLERERHRLGEVLDRRDLLEDLGQARLARDVLAVGEATLDHGVPLLVADQPVEAVGLESEKLGNLERLVDLREADAARSRNADGAGGTGGYRGAARGQETSFDRNAGGERRTTTASATGQADEYLRAGAKRHVTGHRGATQYQRTSVASRRRSLR